MSRKNDRPPIQFRLRTLLALQAMDERRDPTSRRYISQFFADSAFYRQYVSELERVSAEAYVDAMQRDLAPKLDPSLRMLRREFPSLEIDWHSVRRAAEFIRIALHPPQAVQAYLRTAAPGELVNAGKPDFCANAGSAMQPARKNSILSALSLAFRMGGVQLLKLFLFKNLVELHSKCLSGRAILRFIGSAGCGLVHCMQLVDATWRYTQD